MVFFPVVFFISLLFIIYKKRGVDVSFFMTLIYAVSSVFAVVLRHSTNSEYLVDYNLMDVGLLPTLIYCILLGLTILPFYRFNSNKVRNVIIISNTNFLNVVLFIYIVTLAAFFILFGNQLIQRVFLSGMADMRNLYYMGELDSILSSLSGLWKYIGFIVITISGSAYFLIPIFFYSVCFLNRSKLYNSLIFISTLSPIVVGAVNLDRSSTFYWALLMGLGFFMFRPYIVGKTKKFIRRIAIVFGVTLATYFLAVSIARFGDAGSSDTIAGLIDYIGQPYLNFCHIWKNLWVNSSFLGSIFPTISFLFGGETSLVEYNNGILASTGLDLNVFFSYIGLFLICLGHIAAIIIPVCIIVIINSVINKYNKYNTITISIFIVVYMLAIIPQCGCISYFYTSVPRTCGFVFFILLAQKLKYK